MKPRPFTLRFDFAKELHRFYDRAHDYMRYKRDYFLVAADFFDFMPHVKRETALLGNIKPRSIHEPTGAQVVHDDGHFQPSTRRRCCPQSTRGRYGLRNASMDDALVCWLLFGQPTKQLLFGVDASWGTAKAKNIAKYTSTRAEAAKNPKKVRKNEK